MLLAHIYTIAGHIESDAQPPRLIQRIVRRSSYGDGQVPWWELARYDSVQRLEAAYETALRRGFDHDNKLGDICTVDHTVAED